MSVQQKHVKSLWDCFIKGTRLLCPLVNPILSPRCLISSCFYPKISLLWYLRFHHEFTGYFQGNKWRISDNLVVLIVAAVFIQSYVHLPGKRGGSLWKWKQQPCRRQCTSLNYLFQHLKERKALFREDAKQDCCTAITVNSSNNKTV